MAEMSHTLPDLYSSENHNMGAAILDLPWAGGDGACRSNSLHPVCTKLRNMINNDVNFYTVGLLRNSIEWQPWEVVYIKRAPEAGLTVASRGYK